MKIKKINVPGLWFVHLPSSDSHCCPSAAATTQTSKKKFCRMSQPLRFWSENFSSGHANFRPWRLQEVNYLMSWPDRLCVSHKKYSHTYNRRHHWRKFERKTIEERVLAYLTSAPRLVGTRGRLQRDDTG